MKIVSFEIYLITPIIYPVNDAEPLRHGQQKSQYLSYFFKIFEKSPCTSTGWRTSPTTTGPDSNYGSSTQMDTSKQGGRFYIHSSALLTLFWYCTLLRRWNDMPCEDDTRNYLCGRDSRPWGEKSITRSGVEIIRAIRYRMYRYTCVFFSWTRKKNKVGFKNILSPLLSFFLGGLARHFIPPKYHLQKSDAKLSANGLWKMGYQGRHHIAG